MAINGTMQNRVGLGLIYSVFIQFNSIQVKVRTLLARDAGVSRHARARVEVDAVIARATIQARHLRTLVDV